MGSSVEDFTVDGLSLDRVRAALRPLTKILPFHYYGSIFDPSVVPPKEPGLGDLSDDLMDIYSDLWEGLVLYDRGQLLEAEWCWRFSFESHWGRHASGALRALHCWFADRDGWSTS